MNVHAPETDDDNNDADEADNEDNEDEEPSSPARECIPSLDEPPKVGPVPLILDQHPTIWITGKCDTKGSNSRTNAASSQTKKLHPSQ